MHLGKVSRIWCEELRCCMLDWERWLCEYSTSSPSLNFRGCFFMRWVQPYRAQLTAHPKKGKFLVSLYTDQEYSQYVYQSFRLKAVDQYINQQFKNGNSKLGEWNCKRGARVSMGGDYGGVDNEGSCFEKLHVQVRRRWARRDLGKATFEPFDQKNFAQIYNIHEPSYIAYSPCPLFFFFWSTE